jgi:hypothetical protein
LSFSNFKVKLSKRRREQTCPMRFCDLTTQTILGDRLCGLVVRVRFSEK